MWHTQSHASEAGLVVGVLHPPPCADKVVYVPASGTVVRNLQQVRPYLTSVIKCLVRSVQN